MSRPRGARLLAGPAQAEGKLTLLDPDLFTSQHFRIGISQQMMQQIALGGMMIALPIFLQMVLEYNAMLAGLSLAPLSLSMFAIALLAGKRAGKRRPSIVIWAGFALLTVGVVLLILVVPRAEAVVLAVPLIIADQGWACWSPSSTTSRWRRSRRSGSARRPG